MASNAWRLTTMNVLDKEEISAKFRMHRIIEMYRTNNEHMIKHRLLGSCKFKNEIE